MMGKAFCRVVYRARFDIGLIVAGVVAGYIEESGVLGFSVMFSDPIEMLNGAVRRSGSALMASAASVAARIRVGV